MIFFRAETRTQRIKPLKRSALYNINIKCFNSMGIIKYSSNFPMVNKRGEKEKSKKNGNGKGEKCLECNHVHSNKDGTCSCGCVYTGDEDEEMGGM